MSAGRSVLLPPQLGTIFTGSRQVGVDVLWQKAERQAAEDLKIRLQGYSR
jgi:hypothetical protein